MRDKERVRGLERDGGVKEIKVGGAKAVVGKLWWLMAFCLRWGRRESVRLSA